ncbi:MAG: hypothetical protein HZC36_01530 [Armatimonadetes bacterium]|nr:hypothetical protein [Armatimonadota bacterium]
MDYGNGARSIVGYDFGQIGSPPNCRTAENRIRGRRSFLECDVQIGLRFSAKRNRLKFGTLEKGSSASMICALAGHLFKNC